MQKLIQFLFGLVILLCSGIAIAQSTQTPSSEEDQVFVFVEQEPTFQKGTLEAFLIKNMEYPEDALERKIQGQVFVTFIIDEEGKVFDVNILKGIGYGCDEEALDLINETSGKWNAGVNAGKKVKVRMNVPIVFKLGMPKRK